MGAANQQLRTGPGPELLLQARKSKRKHHIHDCKLDPYIKVEELYEVEYCFKILA